MDVLEGYYFRPSWKSVNYDKEVVVSDVGSDSNVTERSRYNFLILPRNVK